MSSSVHFRSDEMRSNERRSDAVSDVNVAA